MTHLVEGRESTLKSYTFDAEPSASGSVDSLPPVLLIHGFASSTDLNWVQAGWITALTQAGRSVIAVDLPGHGGSAVPEELDEYSPSRIRAEILQTLVDHGVQPLDDSPSSGVDVIGYSLGSRLTWEFAAAQPQLVRRIVLGGPSAVDPLATADLEAAENHVSHGEQIQDPVTAELIRMAQLVPGNDMFASLSLIRAIRAEPFDAAESVPRQPALLVAGEKDELAETMPQLAELLKAASGIDPEQLILPARSHANAITSRAFKQAAIEFLGR